MAEETNKNLVLDADNTKREVKAGDAKSLNIGTDTETILTGLRPFNIPKKVKVKLSKLITNNRIQYDAGDTLEVKESTADYLEERELGKRI